MSTMRTINTHTVRGGTEPNHIRTSIGTSRSGTIILTFPILIINTGMGESASGRESRLLGRRDAAEGTVEKQVVADLHTGANEQWRGNRCPLHQQPCARRGQSPAAHSDHACESRRQPALA